MSLENPENIYQVGGSLPVHASTYVRRLADENLYENLLAGNFCYVLNSRQMGKSSLRVQTMKRLQKAGIICVAIDLTSIGSQDITPEQWYAGIIYSLASGLELLDKFNLGEWWQERQFLAPLQRLSQFLSEIVLREIQGKIVIFIDEIDSVLSLSFNVDDFFGLIRSCYQKDSNYERLAFALLGVASPTDLIRNNNIHGYSSTPFNIGEAIDLQGFQLSEAMPLAKGLSNIFEKPEEILRDILDWTGGQPFLTQKVCKLVSKYGKEYSENIVSNIVQEKIIENWEGQDEPEHLKTIRDRVLYSSKNKYKLLELYDQILQKGAINDQNLPEYTELRLTGLVVKQNSKLQVYNRIYAEVFNLEWLRDEFKSSGWMISSEPKEDINDPFTYFSQGLDYYNKRDYHRAISNFEQVIKIDPLHSMAYNNRGRSFFKLGKYQEAINDYNQAIAINPNSSLTYRNRGDVHCSLNNYQAAIADYNLAIQLDPKSDIAHMGWAIAQKKLHQSLTATSNIQENIDIKPNINQDLFYKTFEFETVTVNSKGEVIKQETKQAQYFTEILSEDVSLDMVLIPAGEFMMGANKGEAGASPDEYPQHKVKIAQSFFMGKYPITQAQYEAIMSESPSHFKGENRPVEKVTWDKAVEFCRKLSEKTGKIYCLPSEAQWEYAGRAGTTTPFYFGETIIHNLANYNGNYLYAEETTKVGIFPPNAFGLYDIHGNVWEWCEDIWHDNYKEAPNDCSAWISDSENHNLKVLRGGSWLNNPNLCRVANRSSNKRTDINNLIGFRVCCLVENTDNLVEIAIDTSAVNDYSIANNFDSDDSSNQEEKSFIITNVDNRNIDTKLLKIFEFETVTVNNKGEIIDCQIKQAQYFTEVLPGNTPLDMVEIPGGSFIMGSPEIEIGRYKDEGPQREVTIKTFYMGKYPVTQAQYEAVMNYNPSKFPGKNRPVERVTWQKAKEFCEKLSNLTGKTYILPSEAQWEYAARATTTTPFHYGEAITTQLANYGSTTYNQEPKGEWRKETTDVGIFPPNTFGLYDIHGNVWEWCEDEWHENYEGAPIDGSAWTSSAPENKVLRGGAWNYDPGSCRVANRTCLNVKTIINGVGFRVCCLIQENTDKLENADKLIKSQEYQKDQQLIDAKYIHLQQLLANQQWKEADQETARVMLKIAKREEEGFFNIQAIENFPCDDLNIIDKLWLKYSNSLFGFSIQRNIWLEYGGKLDYETQCKLGDRLGWRKEETWLKYEELDFDMATTYPGYLPWYVWGFLIFGKTSALISKIMSCNLSNTKNKDLIFNVSNQRKLVTTRQKILTEEGFLGDFAVNGKLIRIFQGDITNLVVDVIVTSDDDSLSMEGILSRKIRAMAGEEIYQELQKLELLCIGDIGITSGGNLSCQKIFHAIVADFANTLFTAPDFKKLVNNALNLAEELQLQTLALPLLGAGGNGFSPRVAWRITLQQIINYFANHSSPYLQEVVIVIHRKELVEPLNIENTLKRISREGWEYLLSEDE